MSQSKADRWRETDKAMKKLAAALLATGALAASTVAADAGGAGYLLVFVNDIELDRARQAVKASERQLQEKDPNLNTTAIWNEASKQTSLPIGPDQCKRTLGNLLNSSPKGAFQVPRP
jgi:hypothetical protein